MNKNVTEDQLRGFIEDIVYIKWITDKETQQFYGSTFLEMKDAKAACTAVMKDKQKFLGRQVKSTRANEYSMPSHNSPTY